MLLGTFQFTTETTEMGTPVSRVIYVNKQRWAERVQGIKDPSDVVDWELNFGAVLGDSMIQTATVSVVGATLDSYDTLTGAVRVWLSGGSAGTDASIKITIVTDSVPARTFERSFKLEIAEL